MGLVRIFNEEGGGLVLAGEGINGDVRVGDKVEEEGDIITGIKEGLGMMNSNTGCGFDLV